MNKFIPFIIECIILFLILPITLSNTPLISNLSNLFSVVINVFLLVIFSLIFGKKKGFSIFLPLIAVAISALSGLVLKYSILRIGFTAGIYLVVTIVGEILGLMFRKKEN